MALNRLKQAASHLTGQVAPAHPFDPLSELEIEHAVALVRKEHSDVHFNAVTLREPRKAEMMAWIKDPEHTERPIRVADVICIGRGSKVFESLVDLDASKVISWEQKDGVQPLVCMFDLRVRIVLTFTDHHGRSPDRGVYRQKRSESNRAMWHHWNPTRRHAQSLL
jgi:primary-amine oxidase